MFQQPEILLTTELADLLSTTKDCTPIQIPFVHREMKRTEKDELFFCPSCNSKKDGKIEGQKTCPYCYGVGILFNDHIKTGYFYSGSLDEEKKNLKFIKTAGRYDSHTTTLVTDIDTRVRKYDIIMVPYLSKEGIIEIPLKYEQTYHTYFNKTMRAGVKQSYNVAILGR